MKVKTLLPFSKCSCTYQQNLTTAVQMYFVLYSFLLVDTAKTRLQLQGSKGDSRFTRTKWVDFPMKELFSFVTSLSLVRYSGFVSCLRRVAGEEGASQLYRGLPPALLRQAVYGSIKYDHFFIFWFPYGDRIWCETGLGLKLLHTVNIDVASKNIHPQVWPLLHQQRLAAGVSQPSWRVNLA